MEGSHPPFLRTSSRFKLFLWTKVLLLDHNFEPCAALLLLDKTLQEFGIGRPPTHELFLDPFLCLFVSSFKTNKQTNTLRSCFHVALYSTFFSGTRLTQLSVILYFVISVQSLITTCSQFNLFRENCLEIALKCFHCSLSLVSPSKTLCPRSILSQEGRHDYKSINKIPHQSYKS